MFGVKKARQVLQSQAQFNDRKSKDSQSCQVFAKGEKMPKLYFKYGTMGSSKTAQALMCKFNYEQKGYRVFLIKPVLDTRDMQQGKIVVKSRIGLFAECKTFDSGVNLYDFVEKTDFWVKTAL